MIYLVSCVSKKRQKISPAKDLYISDWFIKARRYVESRFQNGDRWFILSAKYGLLDPETKIPPYEQTLLDMDRASRTAWARRVFQDLQPLDDPGLTILAGLRYREFLVPMLMDSRIIRIPMAGLSIGKQLAWLDAHSPSPRKALF